MSDSNNEGVKGINSLKPMNVEQRTTEGLIDEALPSRGPLDGLSSADLSPQIPSLDSLHQKLSSLASTAELTPKQDDKAIEKLREQINGAAALGNREGVLDVAVQLEAQFQEMMANLDPSLLTVRPITFEDQQALAHMNHPNDGFSKTEETTSKIVEQQPQRKGILGFFDRITGGSKKPESKLPSKKAVVATTGLTVLTAVGSAVIPSGNHANANTNETSSINENGPITITYTPEQMLKAKYGDIQPGGVDLRGHDIVDPSLGATNVIGGTVGIDSVVGSPNEAPSQEQLNQMKVLTDTEQGVFNHTGSEASVTPEYFPQTDISISGVFRDYYHAHGELAQQGFPTTKVLWEKRGDKEYQVQYFERAIMEYHPEFAAPNNVLLTLLGSQAYDADPSILTAPSPNTTQLEGFNNTSDSATFPETGKTVSGRFLEYWKNHGGLAQQGLPRSNMIVKVSDLDGSPYVMQYFERAVFEYHPKETDEEYKVLLSLLGNTELAKRYSQGSTGGEDPTPTPEPTKIPATPTAVPRATDTPEVPPQVDQGDMHFNFKGGEVIETKGPPIHGTLVNEQGAAALFDAIHDAFGVTYDGPVQIIFMDPNGEDLVDRGIYKNGAMSYHQNIGLKTAFIDIEYTTIGRDGTMYIKIPESQMAAYTEARAKNPGLVDGVILQQIAMGYAVKPGEELGDGAAFKAKLPTNVWEFLGLNKGDQFQNIPIAFPPSQ